MTQALNNGRVEMATHRRSGIHRRALIKGATATAIGVIAAPMISRAQAKPIKIGMPTILSGRVAQLGTSSRNAVMLEVGKVNAAGGLAGRSIEMVIRDSKGQPQEAARVARELVNSDGCEILIDAEASSGAFAVHEVARDLKVLCLHTNSETSALTADPKQCIPRLPPGHPRLNCWRRLRRQGRECQKARQMDDLLAGLRLRSRYHGPICRSEEHTS